MKVRKKVPRLSRFLDKLYNHTIRLSFKPKAFIFSLIFVIVWALTGPIFKFSDTWQLVINIGTTAITFQMVFIILQTQNKDTMALHLNAEINHQIKTGLEKCRLKGRSSSTGK